MEQFLPPGVNVYTREMVLNETWNNSYHQE